MKKRSLFRKKYILIVAMSFIFFAFGGSPASANCVLDESGSDGKCNGYSENDCGKGSDFSSKYCEWKGVNPGTCNLKDVEQQKSYCNQHNDDECVKDELCKIEEVAPPSATATTPAKSDKNAPKIVSLVNPIAGNPDIQTIIGNVILKAMGILGALALLVFVYGGFKWLTAAGREESIKEGTQAMLWAVIGIFIIFGSYAIIKLIYTGLGVGELDKSVKEAIVWCKNEKTNLCEEMQLQECDANPYESEIECTGTVAVAPPKEVLGGG
ncbi:MAG: pilin [Patescibacteria group bacterium]